MHANWMRGWLSEFARARGCADFYMVVEATVLVPVAASGVIGELSCLRGRELVGRRTGLIAPLRGATDPANCEVSASFPREALLAFA